MCLEMRSTGEARLVVDKTVKNRSLIVVTTDPNRTNMDSKYGRARRSNTAGIGNHASRREEETAAGDDRARLFPHDH